MNEDKAIELYLDYVNNYLTIAKFAEHNEITVDEAENIIITGKKALGWA